MIIMKFTFNKTPTTCADGRNNYTFYEYQLVWMIANGKTIPEGYDIHHKDGNNMNNDSDNLVCVPKEIHYLYHNKPRNTTGIHRVHKRKDPTCTQGYLWMYQHRKDGKTITFQSTNLKKLQEKAKQRGLKWTIIDPVKALKSYKESELNAS